MAEFSERAGFLPRPEAFDEKLKPGFRGGRALFIFFLCNAVPFGAAMYYLREQRETRISLSLGALPPDADDVAAEVLRVIRTSGTCFLLQGSSLGLGQGTGGEVLRVDPHAPEAVAYTPPTEPLPLVPLMERNDLTDLLESPPVPGLGFVHFAIARSSPLGSAFIAGHRQASLLYVSHTRGAYCTVAGQISVLSDPESRRRYWKSLWAPAFPLADKQEAATPSAAPPGMPANTEAEHAPGWESPEYLLVRLAVSEATLLAAVAGPQRWDARRVVRRTNAEESGPKWALLAPDA